MLLLSEWVIEMNTNALIKIKTSTADDDTIELMTQGAYYEKNNSYYILYEENEEMGMSNCSVIIKVNGDEVQVTRKGDFSSKMIYKEGDRFEFLYHMPYGAMPIVSTTKKVKINLDENGGDIKLVYHLSVNDENTVNVLRITVEKGK